MKVKIQDYKKSINETAFSQQQILLIWDFYVTKAIASSASQGRKPTDYGIKRLNIADFIKTAGIDDNGTKFLLADSMPKTLKNMDFVTSGEKGDPVEIDIDAPRIAFTTPYTISDDEPPKAKNNCSRAESLLTHMRNAFAHGNTYFFDNGNALFEDKIERKTTAMILIKQQTLLDWIVQVDSSELFYKHSDILGESEKETEGATENGQS